MRRWAPVPGWPNYEVSDDGQVRAWVAPVSRRRYDVPRARSIYFDRLGYSRIEFEERVEGRRRRERFLVHRLVAMCFVDGDQSLHVAHLDGKPSNCHYSNLKWVTRKENESHKVGHGTRLYGERSPVAKLCEPAARAILKLRAEHGWTLDEITRLLEIPKTTVHGILQGRNWAHLSKKGA